MGICNKCQEPCDGEPYCLLVDGTLIANRQYCVAHAPPLHTKEQKEIGHTLTGATLTVTVEWVRGGEVLGTPHQFRSPDYKAGWRDGNEAYRRSMTADTTEYDEWNPPDDHADDAVEEQAIAEAEQEAAEREKAEREKEVAEDYEHRQPDPDNAEWDTAHEGSDHRND